MTGAPSTAPNATALTGPSWPVSGAPSASPERASHSRTVLSLPADTMTGAPPGFHVRQDHRPLRMPRQRSYQPIFPIRYADDFVILVSGTREQAEQEKAELADDLRRTTGLELSEEKTRISDLTEVFEFLGHRVRLKWHRQFGLMPRIEIPNSRDQVLASSLVG